jgi:hypothetical protein
VPFPPDVEALLTQFGIRPETKAALYDLYLSAGPAAIETFGELADEAGSISGLQPADVGRVRHQIAERYVTQNHGRWLDGEATQSFWRPRMLEGRVSGLVRPLNRISRGLASVDPLAARIERIIGDDQPYPDGLLLMGRHAHAGGRLDTISFDLVPLDAEDAAKLSCGSGRQHTLPGSIGATSGTYNDMIGAVLLWEIQPNVWKPSAERNEELRGIWRRLRNWHVATLAAAVQWAWKDAILIYAVAGRALAATHEVNPEEPLTDTVAAAHDRTIERVVGASGGVIRTATPAEIDSLLEAEVMNVSLSRHVAEPEGREAILRIEMPVAIA